MIVRLQGILVSRQPPALVIDVGGVGYEVEAPLSVFDRLPADGEQLTILTHLAVKEDAHTLYGFLAESDRKLFRQLLKVSGIGPRLALAILSGVSGDDFALMVEAGDSQALDPAAGHRQEDRRAPDPGNARPGVRPGRGSRRRRRRAQCRFAKRARR